MEKIKSSNIRAFVSISLSVLLIILFMSAVGIQVIDAMIDPEKYIFLILNPESQESYFLVELQHIIKAIHVIAGFLFIGLSIIHIIKNWNVLKKYIKK
jgi:cytochrome b561